MIAGDPNAKGIFVVRMMLPPKYRIPTHGHPTDEASRSFRACFMSRWATSSILGKGEKLGMDGFAMPPARMILYARTAGETVVQVEAEAPFGMT